MVPVDASSSPSVDIHPVKKTNPAVSAAGFFISSQNMQDENKKPLNERMGRLKNVNNKFIYNLL